MSRSRRSTLKQIDYSKEQEFSDEDDVFEDNINDSPQAAPTSSRKPRQKKAESSTITDDFDSQEYSVKFKYSEKGYDPSLPHLRERFTFMPELELDGTPKIELIVGRRPIANKGSTLNNNGTIGKESYNEDIEDDEDDNEASEDEEDNDEEELSRKRRSKRGRKPKSKKSSEEKKESEEIHQHTEYEYLIKYKGKSYLHLEWKAASELESMNKSAKTLLRRFLKKLQMGTDEDLEDPDIDPSYILPQKIVDDEEIEIYVDLDDKELVEWEKERQRELDEVSSSDEDDIEIEGLHEEKEKPDVKAEHAVKEEAGDDMDDDAEEEIGEPGTLSKETIMKILNKEGPYYPTVEGSDNPYRDGYVTEPPKKSRASYLFFQGVYRSVFQKKYKGSSVSEIMALLGDTWRAMSDEEQAPYIELAKEEAAEYDKHRALLEKAQKPNELWQPIRRCLMLLDKICDDPYSQIFLKPVDLNDFPDYMEYIDSPMDLSTVRKKLLNKKYQIPENYARDMRKIWSNCKIYNQHGSQIWHVADYMSKLFERLYHAWVLGFRERYLRWANPLARPWENSCRKCDGECRSPDEKMVLCDHCDAAYGMNCLDPPISKLPKGIWHCPCCKARMQKDGNARLLSAVSEQAARKRVELGDIPKKKITQKMYLVKWAGLGYEFCTWETKEDINDDTLIADYQQIFNMAPEEPDLLEEEARKILNEKSAKHLTADAAGGLHNIPQLRCQLYSLTRAFQFAKFGFELPEKLCKECGPLTHANSKGDLDKSKREVSECLYDIVSLVSSGRTSAYKNFCALPPPLAGEYDTIIPITKGLMMNVGEVNNSVVFLGYRQFDDGSKGPAELQNVIQKVGDKIIAVDGVSTVNKSFQDVINLLRISGKNKFAFMRLLSQKYAVCNGELTSMGTVGMYTVGEITKQLRRNRRRLLLKKKMASFDSAALDTRVEDSTNNEKAGSVNSKGEDSDTDASMEESNGESDDEDDDMIMTSKEFREERMMLSEMDQLNLDNEKANKLDKQENAKDDPTNSPDVRESYTIVENCSESVKLKDEHSNDDVLDINNVEEKKKSKTKRFRDRQETTRSLSLRLLDIDVGYSSDEGGDDECAYYIDGVDCTFTTIKEAAAVVSDDEMTLRPNHISSYVEGNDDENAGKSLPVKRNDFATLGDRAKLFASISLLDTEPEFDDFDNYPMQSSKQLEKIALAEAAVNDSQTNEDTESARVDMDNEPAKLSKTKIEQVSVSTNEVIRVWANAEEAAATLQISLKEIKQVLKGIYSEDVGDEVGGNRWRYAAENAEVTKLLDPKKEKDRGKKAYLEFKDKLYDHEKPHIYKNGNRLRDYQIGGVNWLASCWYKNHGCILADEMGLGKTVQIVSYIEHLSRVEKIMRPHLVVVPLSTVEHWRREFEGWTNLTCCVYHDRQRIWRDVMREYEWYYVDRPHTPDFLKFDVLVTTYDTLIGDFDVIGQIPWRVTVVDEAHRLRNQKGKLLECMKEISARGTLQYGFQSRVLMTGTPLQNNIQELWTLLNFIEPYKFPSLEDFEAQYGNMASREQVENLQSKIQPYMLRRVKEDVAKDIPAKEETLIDVELTSIQKTYYRAIFERNHAFLNMGNIRNSAPKLMNIQMELRKCCNHPFLLDGIEQRELDKQYRELVESGTLEGMSKEGIQHFMNETGYVKTSGKMVLLDKLLPKLRSEGHKVLIFSQMVKMLDLLSEYCDFRGFRYERLDGRVRGNERQKAIDRFETEKDSFIFMLSTRAGGVGINLTAADICIIFDSDWNPQNDVQAQARCHRIGQTKNVMIYRLITSRSFEQEMFDRASKKLGLEQAVLGTFEKDDDDGKPTAKEMEQLLKKGAYALLEDDDEITNSFCADDIESILAKRTRTRVVEGTKTASWLNKQGMVTKSKFTADSKSAELDMDDPLFWQKVMPDFVTPSLMLKKLEELENQTTESSVGAKTGRGRGRKKKQIAETNPESNNDENKNAIQENVPSISADKIDASPDENDATLDQSEATVKKSKADDLHITRTNQKKINKFIQDLKSMMDGIFEEIEDDNLSAIEKTNCHKLLLTISCKAKLFSEDQRNLARILLERLEGDRRRKCRTGDEGRFADNEPEAVVVNEHLMIRSSKKKRKKRLFRNDDEPESEGKKKNKTSTEYLGEDGYLHHSDSGEDWSDVGDDIYGVESKKGISKKEARRRRAWASDKDAAAAAGRAWPSIPRNKVAGVLRSLLDEVIKIDESKGGLFSKPVPKDTFPDYYDLIKNPMDYGTMKEKLDRGEYRSAQAMQKDFVLIVSNCVQYNAANSEIVKEARNQTLMRPALLRKAALDNHLFLAEDGSVVEVFSDNEGDGDKDVVEKQKKRGRKPKESADNKNESKKAGGTLVKKHNRCNQCENCLREDCGLCEPCQDKKKFGGQGRLKMSCVERHCQNTKEVVSTKKKGRPKKKSSPNLVNDKDGGVDDLVSDDPSETDTDGSTVSKEMTKPRIRISFKKDKNKKIEGRIPKKKRNAKDADTPAKDDSDDCSALTNTDSSRRKRKSPETDTKNKKKQTKMTPISEKKRKKKDVSIDDSSDFMGNRSSPKDDVYGAESSDLYLDTSIFKAERVELDGSVQAARGNFTKRGPWMIPKSLGEDKFEDVASLTLERIGREDNYHLFANAVSESEAPGYSKLIKHPMDFSKIRSKLDRKSYGSGSEALSKLYSDLLLVFDNCFLYNEDNDEILFEAARILGLIPEIFSTCCDKINKKIKGRKVRP